MFSLLGFGGLVGWERQLWQKLFIAKFLKILMTKAYFKHDTETGNLVPYQKEVLKHIFKREFNITSIYSGKQIIRKMLCGRKVLIALDNVSEKGQLDAIVGSHDWFAQGSRIIITSEDK